MDPSNVEVNLTVGEDRVSEFLGAYLVRTRAVYLCPKKLMFDALARPPLRSLTSRSNLRFLPCHPHPHPRRKTTLTQTLPLHTTLPE